MLSGVPGELQYYPAPTTTIKGNFETLTSLTHRLLTAHFSHQDSVNYRCNENIEYACHAPVIYDLNVL
jgi:hypothetical protein